MKSIIRNSKNYFILSGSLILLLFLYSIHIVVIPDFKNVQIEDRKHQIEQMTVTIISLLTNLQSRVDSGELSLEKAQEQASEMIDSLRYGQDRRNYFWVMTTRPDMIVHPYMKDLLGQYIGEYEDIEGKKIYKEMGAIVEAEKSGYVTYSYQKYDDPGIIAVKISYVTLFEDWDWIIGTGFYPDEISSLKSFQIRRILLLGYTMLLLILGITAFLTYKISSLKKQYELLREKEGETAQLFKTIFTSTTQLVGILDRKGRILQANKIALDVIGSTLEEVKGQSFWDSPWLSNSGNEKKRIRDILEEASYGENRRFETVYINQDGTKRFYDISVSPVFDSQGKVRFILPEGRDITERKNMEDQLKKLNENLERQVEDRTGTLQKYLKDLEGTQQQLIQSEKMAALGRLVAGVAHEINTPLGIAVTAASYLDDKTSKVKNLMDQEELTEEEFKNYMDSTRESCSMILANLERAASQIQVFKQVAVDQSDEAIRTFLLKQYLQEIIKSLHPELKKKPCLIEIDCPDDLMITTYPGTISQIFSNLIMNSLKHGFKNRDSGKISIVSYREADDIIIKYRDNGQGIPEELSGKIFEPFYTTARSEGGTGLGLHIVYNIITQKLRGNISVETTPEEGLSFHMEFPVEKTNRSSDVDSE